MRIVLNLLLALTSINSFAQIDFEKSIENFEDDIKKDWRIERLDSNHYRIVSWFKVNYISTYDYSNRTTKRGRGNSSKRRRKNQKETIESPKDSIVFEFKIEKAEHRIKELIEYNDSLKNVVINNHVKVHKFIFKDYRFLCPNYSIGLNNYSFKRVPYVLTCDSNYEVYLTNKKCSSYTGINNIDDDLKIELMLYKLAYHLKLKDFKVYEDLF